MPFPEGGVFLLFVYANLYSIFVAQAHSAWGTCIARTLLSQGMHHLMYYTKVHCAMGRANHKNTKNSDELVLRTSSFPYSQTAKYDPDEKATLFSTGGICWTGPHPIQRGAR